MKYFWSITLSLFFLSCSYAQNTLNANLSVPNQITENQDFSILLTIEKPKNFRPYTIYTQKFPAGFFINTKNISADAVSFRNQTLTITWIRLSSEKILKIPLQISYIKGIKGTFLFSGKLTYMIDNKKGEYKLKNHDISITPENKSTYLNLDKYQKNYKIFQNINCIREIELQKDYSYIIKLNITNISTVNKFILTEEIPQNFSIQPLNKPGIKISSKNRIIQFIQKNNQKNKAVVLKYQLIPKNKNKTQKPIIFGKLACIENGQIINIPVKNQSQTPRF